MKKPNTKSNTHKNLNSYEDKKDNVFMQGNLSNKLQITEENILSYLNENKSILESANNSSNFKISSIEKDSLGYTKVKAIQVINGIPIRGSELIIHLDKNGVVKNIIGSINKSFKSFDKATIKTIMPDEAIDIAKKQFNYTTLQKTPEVKEQFIIKNQLPILIYSVNIYYTEPETGNWDVLIDSATGKILANIDNIKYGTHINHIRTLFNKKNC